MTKLAVIDVRELEVTPFFMLKTIENIPKSEAAGYAVYDTMEVVQVQIAGDRNNSPIFPADAMSHREGIREITYAERWADQYQAFKEGETQQAGGTPLDVLQSFGVTPEQASLCRALKIYSVEALDSLEGQKIKSLGMHQNKLKEAARRFMADRSSGSEALDRISQLEAQIAALTAAKSEVEIDEVEAQADDTLSEDFIRAELERLTGTAPHHRLGPDKLRAMYKELTAT